MKKIIPIILIILLFSSIVIAIDINGVSIYDDPSFEELKGIEEFFSLFTIATTQTTALKPGESTILAVDEVANEACNNAILSLIVKQTNGISKTMDIIKGYNAQRGSRLAKTFRWYVPNIAGEYLFEGRIVCDNTGKIISKTSSLTLKVGQTTICKEEFVSKAYCDDVTNRLIRRFSSCPSGIIQNKVVNDCDAKGLSCYQGACTKLEESQKVCEPGETLQTFFQNDVTIRSYVCTSSGLDTKIEDTKCESGLICSGAECKTPKVDQEDKTQAGDGICCKNLDSSIFRLHSDRSTCPALWRMADNNLCSQSSDSGDVKDVGGKKQSIEEDDLNTASKVRFELAKCDLDTECSDDGKCIPFDQFSKGIQDRVSEFFRKDAATAYCVITKAEGSQFSGGGTFKFEDIDFISGLAGKAKSVTGAIFSIVAIIFGFFIISSLFQRKS